MRLRSIVIRLCWPRSDIQGRQRKIEEAVRDDGHFGTAALAISTRSSQPRIPHTVHFADSFHFIPCIQQSVQTGTPAMTNKVTATSNTIRIPDPSFLQLVGWIGSGSAVGWLLWQRRDSIQLAAAFFRDFLKTRQSLEITATVLQTQLLPQAILLLAALMAGGFALKGCVGGGWTLLGWLRRLGGDHYASAPGPLAEGAAAVERLFGDGGIVQQKQQEPPQLVRWIFGNTSWWLSPSATGLIAHFDLALKRLALLSLLLVPPAFLQPGWLPDLLSRLEPSEDVLRAAAFVESGLHWTLPVPYLLVIATIIATLWMSVLLVRGRPVSVQFEEMEEEFPNMPHPDDTYRKIERELKLLRYREFPNRKPGGDRPPGLTTMQPGQAGSFRFQHTIETQPVPMGSGRSIPSLFLLLMGSLLTVAGYWLLLRSPGLLDQPFKTAVWLPALATAVTAIRSGRRMRQTAWELAHTFRFSSELIRISGNGSWYMGQVAVEHGLLGGSCGNQSAVTSRVYLQVQAAQLTTEVCAHTNVWRPIGEAMQSPRTIMSAEKSTAFRDRLNVLLDQLRDFHRPSSLPSIDYTTGGAAQTLAINQQLQQNAGYLAGFQLPPTDRQKGHLGN